MMENLIINMTPDEWMDGLNKGIELNLPELKTMCNKYHCELKREGCYYWIVPDSAETIPSDILEEMRIKAIVVSMLIEGKNDLMKRYPLLSDQIGGFSNIS